MPFQVPDVDGEAIIAVGCVFFGALFAATDAAVNAIPEARLRALVQMTDGDSPLQRFVDDPTRVLARLLFCRSLCIVAAAAIATAAAMHHLPHVYLAVPIVGTTLVYSWVAEVAVTAARARATTLAPILLRISLPFELAVVPLAAPLLWIGRNVAALISRRQNDGDPVESARLAEAEVEYLIQKGKETGELNQAELLEKAVDFRMTIASQVMVPRTKIVALQLNTPLSRAIELITLEGHSRYPVYQRSIDDVVGLLYVKDIFRIMREGRAEGTTLDSLVRKPILFVQEAQKVDTILKEMRARRLHMAVVLDEFGGTSGIVTLEDILELLVGDIQDELDDEERVQDLGDGRLLIDASLPVERLSSRLGVSLPEGAGFVSVGGMVMEQLGKVPETGTVVQVGPVDFVVRDADGRRVRRIEVVARPERADAASL